MIDQPERLFESRMRDRSGEELTWNTAECIHELHSGFPEVTKNLLDTALVVPRFVSFSIVQVGRCEFSDARDVVGNPRHPQRLQVEQMSGMFLRRPFFFRLPPPPLMRISSHNLLQPCGRASQTDAEVGI